MNPKKRLKQLYDNTLGRLLNHHKLAYTIGLSEIKDHSIRITKYPFEPASIYPEKEIAFQEMEEIHLETFPPTIRLGKELIFISRAQREALQDFAQRNQLKTAQRSSNWSLITEPFLDNEFDEQQQAQTRRILQEHGFSDQETSKLRAEIGQQMERYNFDTRRWEWVSLGLDDVLIAMRASLGKAAFHDFYWRAMEIEQRPGSNPVDRP